MMLTGKCFAHTIMSLEDGDCAHSFQILYVASGSMQKIACYLIDQASGGLTHYSSCDTSTAGVIQSAGDMEIFDNRYLYLIDGASSDIATYAIDSSGKLSLISKHISTGYNPWALYINGDAAYVPNELSNTISMFSINNGTGILAPLTPPSVNTNSLTGPVTVSQSPMYPQYMYVAGYLTNQIAVYKENPETKVLSDTGIRVNTPTSPRFISFYQNYAYLVSENSDQISQYVIDAKTGNLIPMVPSSVNVGIGCVMVAIYNNNLYAVGKSTNKIYMFTISNSGGLIAKNPSSVNTQQAPNSAITDSENGMFYVGNTLSNTISEFKINESGLLEFSSVFQANIMTPLLLTIVNKCKE